MNKLLCILLSCGISGIVFGQAPFQEIPFQEKPDTLVIPAALSYTILFSEGDTISLSNGKWARAKGGHDMTLVLPDATDKLTTLVISHECNDSSSLLGDGGGLSLVPITLTNDHWKVSGPIKNVDFTIVGGTYDNCSGTLVEGKNTILTAEEGTPESNEALSKHGRGYRDVSDFNGLPRYKNTGWIVEVDPKTNKAIQKLYGMGRFYHESVLVMEDGKTVYLTDDFAPSVFFKFIAEQKNDFSKGQLYAYK
ncbi:MAG: DUF839 domain-containing protein, partial [Cytophagales bacterium]|nr:DUF839 domain-containing protein [Cytophaga sp.]